MEDMSRAIDNSPAVPAEIVADMADALAFLFQRELEIPNRLFGAEINDEGDAV